MFNMASSTPLWMGCRVRWSMPLTITFLLPFHITEKQRRLGYAWVTPSSRFGS